MSKEPSNTLKDRVKSFWNAAPCGTRDISAKPGSIEFLQALERQRDDLEPYIRGFAEFDRWKGKKVLEVGFGAGVDFVRFARAGADLSGIDLTEAGKEAVDRWLELEGLAANTQVADAENLPFESDTFDLAYSWGVIHHTPDTPKAAKELLRVVKPGGEVRAMIYHKPSLVCLQAYLAYGLFRGKPFRPMDDILANHVESPGTKAYSLREAAELFSNAGEVTVRPKVTRYDLRITRSVAWPRFLESVLPQNWGWFLLVRAVK
jgi:ubiquinone/menaquinone biosynthesis C-methylase UbiE